jgi:acyl-CoA thioesterase I
MRVVLAADSLALPRPKDLGNNCYADIYGGLLRKRLSLELGYENVEVLNHGRRANTIRQLDTPNSFFDDVSGWEPDIVILQVGIVDCAPRLFSRTEHFLVSQIRPAAFRDRFIQFVGHHRRFILQHMPQKVYVPLDEFSRRYTHVRDQILQQGIKVLLVNICPTNTESAFRSPGLSENIVIYNRVISEAASAQGCALVDIHKELKERNPDNFILNDGIHINQAGHLILADTIYDTLVKFKWIPICRETNK